MKVIKVSDFLPSAFSNEQAESLKNRINEVLEEDRIIVDFANITKFTTLFFNFSTGYFINLLGKEKYDSKFDVINLNELGESTYNHSYNNSVRDETKGSADMQEKILNIINSTDDN